MVAVTVAAAWLLLHSADNVDVQWLTLVNAFNNT